MSLMEIFKRVIGPKETIKVIFNQLIFMLSGIGETLL